MDITGSEYVLVYIIYYRPLLWQPLDIKSNNHITSKSLKADI